MKALFVDTSSRTLPVQTVSVTEVLGRGLVLRFGAEVGSLTSFSKRVVVDMPIILSTMGYQAQSSWGFVETVASCGWETSLKRVTVIGALGLSSVCKANGLVALGRPIHVILLPPGSSVVPVKVHGNSNPETNMAARAAMKLRSDLSPNSAFVVEGQSDSISAWEFVAPKQASRWDPVPPVFEPEWPVEHQVDRFSNIELLKRVVTWATSSEKTEAARVRLVLMIAAFCAAFKYEYGLSTEMQKAFLWIDRYWSSLENGAVLRTAPQLLQGFIEGGWRIAAHHSDAGVSFDVYKDGECIPNVGDYYPKPLPEGVGEAIMSFASQIQALPVDLQREESDEPVVKATDDVVDEDIEEPLARRSRAPRIEPRALRAPRVDSFSQEEAVDE